MMLTLCFFSLCLQLTWHVDLKTNGFPLMAWVVGVCAPQEGVSDCVDGVRARDAADDDDAIEMLQIRAVCGSIHSTI